MTDEQVFDLESEGPTVTGWSRLFTELIHTRDIVMRLKEEARYSHKNTNDAQARMITLEMELMELKR